MTTLEQPKPAQQKESNESDSHMNDIPTHPLNCVWTPCGCHPVIAAIPNWQKKIAWPWPRAARLRRQMLKRGLRLGLPRPLTNASANWSEWKAVLNGAKSNMATPAATTYGLPIYNPATGFHLENPERNEIWDNPELLRFVCHNGKARGQWPNKKSLTISSEI